MKKKIILLLFIVCMSMAGCDNANHKREFQVDYSDANYKEQIQTRLGNANPSGAKGVCFGIAAQFYPYTSTFTPPIKSKSAGIDFHDTADVDNEMNQRLHVFAQIGFLSEEPMKNSKGQPIYRYDLTDLGNRYYYYYGGISDGFCFGRVNVIRLVQPPSFFIQENDEFRKDVYFEYEIDNIPDWVTENKVLLSQVYDDILPLLEKKQDISRVQFEQDLKSSNQKNREWHLTSATFETQLNYVGNLFFKFEKGWLD